MIRAILAVLAVRHGLFAAWTLVAPRWFFDDFPLVLALVVLLGSRRLPVATVAPGGQWSA